MRIGRDRFNSHKYEGNWKGNEPSTIIGTGGPSQRC